MNAQEFFSPERALAEYEANKCIWTDGAVIVSLGDGLFQAMPGHCLTNVSYTGPRETVDVATVRAAMKTRRE